MQKIYLFIPLLVGLLLFSQTGFTQCATDTLKWGDNAIWSAGDVFNTYTIPHAGGVTTVEVEIVDIHNRNQDGDLYFTHPFDPIGGCKKYPGATGNSEIDDTPGDGSIVDPWDSDCNNRYTESNGVAGNGYLSWLIDTQNHEEEVTFIFRFSDPIILNDFQITDIDYIGLGNTFFLGRSMYEQPGDSYQDEIFIEATSYCGGTSDLDITAGSNLVVEGTHIYAKYTSVSSNGDVTPNTATNIVTISSLSAITELRITYSNGPEDAAWEQTIPGIYGWWSTSHGPTNGVSDDQLIRLDPIALCFCPEMPITFVPIDTICNGEEVTLSASVTGGTGPYTYEWSDGLGNTPSVVVSSDFTRTYHVTVTDALCCGRDTSITVNVDACYDIDLRKSVDVNTAQIGDTRTFTLTVTNDGSESSTGVSVTDNLPLGLTYTGNYTASQGTYNGSIWMIGTVPVGGNLTLDIEVTVDSLGVTVNQAEITGMNESDLDSAPNNGELSEDDIATACISVPYEVCHTDTSNISMTIVAPSGGATYQWYFNGSAITGATSQSYTATQVGSYNYTSELGDANSCDFGLCCDLVIQAVACDTPCPPFKCLPVTVTIKRGSRN